MREMLPKPIERQNLWSAAISRRKLYSLLDTRKTTKSWIHKHKQELNIDDLNNSVVYAIATNFPLLLALIETKRNARLWGGSKWIIADVYFWKWQDKMNLFGGPLKLCREIIVFLYLEQEETKHHMVKSVETKVRITWVAPKPITTWHVCNVFWCAMLSLAAAL